ncbi:hypothetical protein [Francisella philomiragia]|nr:hypothetical protein [Francisella philomiragia]
MMICSWLIMQLDCGKLLISVVKLCAAMLCMVYPYGEQHGCEN